ncbi:hypothetical protein ABKV19_025646 [Rosa sericea]
MGILEPFRAIGYTTTSVPFSVQRLGTEAFDTVSVGRAFQIYNLQCAMKALWSSLGVLIKLCGYANSVCFHF